MCYLYNACLVVFASVLVSCAPTVLRSLLWPLNASSEDICTAVRPQRPKEHMLICESKLFTILNSTPIQILNYERGTNLQFKFKQVQAIIFAVSVHF